MAGRRFPGCQNILGGNKEAGKFQNKMTASALELISFILKTQLTLTRMWAFSVSKMENALKTEMRDIKMKIKKNEQCNAVLGKIRKTTEIRGRVKGKDHKTMEELIRHQGSLGRSGEGKA